MRPAPLPPAAARPAPRSRARLAAAAFAALALALPAAAGAVPEPVRATLPDGLQVLIVPTTRLPLVDLRLVAHAGSVNDPAGREGLARLTSELLTQGAGRRSAQQLADDIEFVGGSLAAEAGPEQFVVTCEVLRKDLATGLELFRDCIVSPAFAADELARKRSEALGGIASDRSDPSTIADRAIARWLWGASPLAHPPIGTAAGLAAITRDDVVAFHRRYVTPGRSVLVVVGDVDPAALIARLREAFAGWAAGGEPLAAAPYGPAAPLHGLRVRVIRKPEATQAQIRFACPGVARGSPDQFAIEVANTILGGGFTSRLVSEVRVERGLTYSIGSRFSEYRAAGAFGIDTFTRNDQLRACVDATLAGLRRLVRDGPTEAELDKAHAYLAGQYPLGLQAPDDLAAEIANVQFYGLPPDYIATYAGHVRAVTLADVRRVLQAHFCTTDLDLVVVTNADVARKALAGLAPLEVRGIE